MAGLESFFLSGDLSAAIAIAEAQRQDRRQRDNREYSSGSGSGTSVQAQHGSSGASSQHERSPLLLNDGDGEESARGGDVLPSRRIPGETRSRPVDPKKQQRRVQFRTTDAVVTARSAPSEVLNPLTHDGEDEEVGEDAELEQDSKRSSIVARQFQRELGVAAGESEIGLHKDIELLSTRHVFHSAAPALGGDYMGSQESKQRRGPTFLERLFVDQRSMHNADAGKFYNSTEYLRQRRQYSSAGSRYSDVPPNEDDSEFWGAYRTTPLAVDGKEDDFDHPDGGDGLGGDRTAFGSKALLPTPVRSAPIREYLMFTLAGVAMLMVKNSILGVMPYFVKIHGAKAQSSILAAYNVPSLLVFFVQMRFDASLNEKFGHRPAYFTRFLLSFTGLMVCAFLLAVRSVVENLFALLVISTMIGFFTGVTYGAFFQFASHFPTSCTPLLLLGSGVSCLMLILFSWPLGLLLHADTASQLQLDIYFGFAMFVVLCALVGTIVVLLGSPILVDDLARLKTNLLLVGKSPTSSQERSPKPTRSLTELFPHVRIPMLAMFINLLTTVVVNVYLAYVPTSGALGPALVQFLNYGNTISDFVGRQLVIFQWFRRKSSNQILLSVVLRCLGTAMIFWYIFVASDRYRNDYVAVAFVSIYSAIGAYSNTMIYTIFQAEYQHTLTADERARGTTLLNIALQIGVFLALPAPFLFHP